jgi:hypothetical protein
MGNPVKYVDLDGFAPLLNNSGRPVWIKPEDDDSGVAKVCLPGQKCDVDGVYPDDPSKARPVKIPDTCRSNEVGEDGLLRCKWCLLPYWQQTSPRTLSPEDLKLPEFSNWPNPYDSSKPWK